MNPGDTLITFNWDLLQEILLSKAGKWSYEDGYGIQTTSEKPLNPSPITILKPHGSCNWALRNRDDLSLRIDYTDVFLGIYKQGFQNSNPPDSTSDYGDSLIVPSYLKNPLQVKILCSVWEAAASALREAESLVILGYSLPEADVSARQLFSEMMQLNITLTSITLVLYKDEESFNRWETVVGNYRTICKRVRHKFEEFITSK